MGEREVLCDTGSDYGDVIQSDSDGEDIQTKFIAGVGRLNVPGFLKRTYGVDYTSDSSLEPTCKSVKLAEQLDGLRALLPNSASRGQGKGNVLTDAYHYIVSLQRQAEDLTAELRDDSASPDAAQTWDEQCCEGQWSLSGLWQQPIVDVAERNGLLEVRIVCADRPGLLVDVMEAVESRGFTIVQARIASHNEIVVYLSLEDEDSGSLLREGEKKAECVEEEEVARVKAMLVHAICKGGNFGSDDVDY